MVCENCDGLGYHEGFGAPICKECNGKGVREMNKVRQKDVRQLQQDIDKFQEKKNKQIEKIQNKCKHKNVERWSDYCGLTEQCRDCLSYLKS